MKSYKINGLHCQFNQSFLSAKVQVSFVRKYEQYAYAVGRDTEKIVNVTKDYYKSLPRENFSAIFFFDSTYQLYDT